MPQELVSWIVILIAAPLMLAGFFKYNDMFFEQFAVEFFYFYFFPQKRVYSYEPVFADLRKKYIAEELQEEMGDKAEKSLLKRLSKKMKGSRR